MSREIFLTEQSSHAFHALPLFARNLQQRRVFAGNLCDRGIPQEANHLTREVCRAVTFTDEVVDLAQHFVACAASDRPHYFFENVRGSCAD